MGEENGSMTMDPVRTYQCTNRLRWVDRVLIRGLSTKRVLQQAWQCVEDGSIVWRDVPVEGE